MKNEYSCIVFVPYHPETDRYDWGLLSPHYLENWYDLPGWKSGGWVIRQFLINGHSYAPVTSTVVTDDLTKQQHATEADGVS